MINKINPIQIQNLLRGVPYPANKNDIVNYAQDSGAGEEILQVLQAMPGERFNDTNDVSNAISSL